MLVSLAGRRLYYDLVGPEDGPVVCITHSLASDSGMWAEQMPPLLQVGFRVLRIDMRGHGGSDPVAGDYSMKTLAGDVAVVLEALSLPPRALYRAVDRRHDRPGFRDRVRRQADFGIVE
jgi:3-oxoadipate enol-lactonase